MLLLDLSYNGSVDGTLSKWDAMFQPLSLRQALIESINNQQKLVHETKMLNRRPIQSRNQDSRNLFWTSLLAVGVIFLSTLKSFTRNFPTLFLGIARVERLSYIAIVALLMLISSVLSLGLIVHEIIGSQPQMTQNWNLLLFLPLDPFLVLLCLERSKKMSFLSTQSMLIKGLYFYLNLRVLTVLGLAVFWITGGIEQNISWSLQIALPAMLLVFFYQTLIPMIRGIRYFVTKFVLPTHKAI